MSQAYELASVILIYTGVFFMVVAAIGLLRMPDFYIRMSAITKAGTLGLGFIALGIGVSFNETSVLIKVLGIIFFVFLSSPVSAHVIGRAAFRDKVPFWKKTVLDDFKPFLRRHDAGQQTDVEKKDL